MDPVKLLEPRGEEEPSGENLEYDPVFLEMELAAQPGDEVQIGDTVTEAHPPEYKEVQEKALAVLERSHDLRAAVFLADAMLNTGSLKDFADVTQYIRGCLEQYWDTCQPELDPDDDDDPTMRINAIAGLCGQPGGDSGPSPVYRSLIRSPLSESRGFGRFTYRDIEIAEGTRQPPADMDNLPDSGAIAAAFQDSDKDVLTERRDAAQRAGDNIKAISAVFDDKTPGQGPDLAPTQKILFQIAKTIGGYLDDGGDTVQEGDIAEQADAEGSIATGPAAAAGAVGAIRSPADVSRALDTIIDYYRRQEPSSPIPILLIRAKRLVSADFLTIVKDMAPHGLENVNLIGGIED